MEVEGAWELQAWPVRGFFYYPKAFVKLTMYSIEIFFGLILNVLKVLNS